MNLKSTLQSCSLYFKCAAVGLLALLLLIPLSLIGGLITDRQCSRRQAIASFQQTWSSDQSLGGPILAIPCTERVVRRVWNDKEMRETTRIEEKPRIQYLLPQTVEWNVSLPTEERYRGIYRFPVYSARLEAACTFRIEPRFGLPEDANIIAWGKPCLVVGISDTRGIRDLPQLAWNGATLAGQPGTNGLLFESGIHAPLDLSPPAEAVTAGCTLSLGLNGMDSLLINPAADAATIRMQSTWPHPNFLGRFPVENRTISADGFRASWSVSNFASGVRDLLANDPKGFSSAAAKNAVGVALAQPVDVYRQSERSVKYGILFVAFTFAGFFLFEVLRRTKIHPLQYTLVGAALALFFLLLLSLSEHIPFAWAYLTAASGCIGLIAFYLARVLGGLRPAALFSAALAVIYAMLYVLLQSEDYALLMGSVLLFAALALFMALTRHINWYQIPQPPPLPAASQPETLNVKH